MWSPPAQAGTRSRYNHWLVLLLRLAGVMPAGLVCLCAPPTTACSPAPPCLRQLSKAQADGARCNVWVYCPSPTGECWSPDICEPGGAVCWAAGAAPACRRTRMLPLAWGAPPRQPLV